MGRPRGIGRPPVVTADAGRRVQKFVTPGWVTLDDAARMLGHPYTREAYRWLIRRIEQQGLQAGLRKRWLARPYRRLDGLTVNIRWWEVSLPTVARLLKAQLQEQWRRANRTNRLGLRPSERPRYRPPTSAAQARQRSSSAMPPTPSR